MTLDPLRPVLAAAAAVLLSAGVGHADDTDNQFLAGLQGINLPPGDAIDYAHQICDADNNLPRSGTGVSRPLTRALRKIQNDLEGRGLSDAQAKQLMLDAVTTYCPEKTDSP